jgi:hypothetical protein
MANTLLPLYQDSQLLAGFGFSKDIIPAQQLEKWYAEHKLLTLDRLPEGTEIKNGALVELQGRLLRNPLLTALDAFLQMMNIGGYETETSTSRAYPARSTTEQGESAVLDIFQSLRNQLAEAPLQDCLMESEGDLLVIVTVPKSTLPLLFKGDYRIIGKVSRVIPPGHELSLYEETSYNYLDKSFIDSSFEELSDVSWIRLPNITTHLPGPAIQILPITVLI